MLPTLWFSDPALELTFFDLDDWGVSHFVAGFTYDVSGYDFHTLDFFYIHTGYASSCSILSSISFEIFDSCLLGEGDALTVPY